MMFECSWRRVGAKGKETAEKVKAASSSKLQDRFKIASSRNIFVPYQFKFFKRSKNSESVISIGK